MLAERGSAQLVKARKGPAAAPTPPLQGTKKINLCYRGFNKWRFDIVHHKLSVLMSSSSSSASCQRSWRRRWERQPRPQAVIQLPGTATQTRCVLHQLLLEPKPSEDCPESQKPAASQRHPHWPGPPRRAAAGRGQCRPQYHILEQSLVLPFTWTNFPGGISALFGMNSPQKTRFALNPRLRPHCWPGHPGASAASTPQPASCRGCRGAPVVMGTCSKALAVTSSTTFKPILIPLAPKAPVKTEPLGELHQEAANKQQTRDRCCLNTSGEAVRKHHDLSLERWSAVLGLGVSCWVPSWETAGPTAGWGTS